MEQKQREFAEFYAAAKDDCLRIVLVSTGDRQLAEDLVAEAFTRAWMSWRKVRDHPAPRAWVVRAALNAHVSWWRRRRREVPLAETEPPAVWQPAGIGDALAAAVRALPARQREVIVLRVFFDSVLSRRGGRKVNDDEMLATMRSSLTGLKESLTDVRLERSADAIRAGARGRRLRRGLAGAGAGGTALGVGLALAAGGPGTLAAGSGPVTTAPGVHVNLAAWSVNTQSSGLVNVDLRELVNPGLLRQTLARAGVHAIVTFGEFCDGGSAADYQHLQPILGKSGRGEGIVITIDPAAIPAGSELSIGIVKFSDNGPKGFDNSFALVKKGSPLTCGTPVPAPGWNKAKPTTGSGG